MSEISGVTARRHFSPDEEEALRHDESTSSIVKRDAKSKVDIGGLDRNWVDTKHHQQSPLDNKMAAFEVGHAAIEGIEIAEVLHLGVAGAVASPIAGFALGLHTLHEAHVKGDEQAQALAKDDMHVALIGALDLPESYQAARFDTEYRHVAKGNHSPAFKTLEALRADTKGLATLQLHADRGMNAARDLSRSGLGREAFLKANPRVAESYVKDSAFREGFEAYMHVRTSLPPADLKALDAKLDERDGWYAQSHVSFRV